MKTPSLWFTLRIICERSTDKPDYGLTPAEAADAAIVDFDDMDADTATIDDASEVEAVTLPDTAPGLTVFEMDFLLTAENTADGLSEFDSSVFFMIPGFDILATETRPADTTEAAA